MTLAAGGANTDTLTLAEAIPWLGFLMIAHIPMTVRNVVRVDFLRSRKQSKDVIQWRSVLGRQQQQTAVGTRDEVFDLLRVGGPAGPPFY